MRIAQMLDTLHMGGAQKMQIFLVQSLQPLGIDVTVINLGDAPNESVQAELQAAGAKIVTIPFNGMFDPLSFIKLIRFLRSEKFDLLHAYLTYSNTIGSFAGWLCGIPVIASLRNAGYNSQTVPRRRIVLENIALKYFASRVTANGYSVAEFARKRLGNKPIDIIVNSVDVTEPLPANERILFRQQLTGDPENSIIFSAGRLVNQKGFADLITAFNLIHSNYPKAILVIAGSGNLEGQLRSLVEEMLLQKQVLFLGFRSDVQRLMQAADIYVNSSYWEGTPVSVLEAMANGLPVIATAVGENPYLLESDCGVLVSSGAPSELAEALDRLLSAPHERTALGVAARQRVEQKYSREMWRKTLLNLYAQVTPVALPFLSKPAQNEMVKV